MIKTATIEVCLLADPDEATASLETYVDNALYEALSSRILYYRVRLVEENYSEEVPAWASSEGTIHPKAWLEEPEKECPF